MKKSGSILLVLTVLLCGGAAANPRFIPRTYPAFLMVRGGGLTSPVFLAYRHTGHEMDVSTDSLAILLESPSAIRRG